MAGRPFWDLKPVMLKSDRAAIMVRRAMEKLLANEAAEQA
jgi:hypothetical protein